MPSTLKVLLVSDTVLVSLARVPSTVSKTNALSGMGAYSQEEVMGDIGWDVLSGPAFGRCAIV